MKKILSLSTVGIIIAPIVAVVSCGSTPDKHKTETITNPKESDYHTDTNPALLAQAKKDAIKSINGMAYPLKDNALHDSSLFPAIEKAKQNALKAIESGTTHDIVSAMASSIHLGSEVLKVQLKIDAYVTSTGTIHSAVARLINLKIIAKGFVNAIIYPELLSAKTHDSSLFGAIAIAKKKAIDSIENAPDEASINLLASSTLQGSAIQTIASKIVLYTLSSGTDALLQDAISKSNKVIDDIPLPYKDNNLHDAKLFSAIALSKSNAHAVINSSTSVIIAQGYAKSSIVGSQVILVNAAIQNYNNSHGVYFVNKQIVDGVGVTQINLAIGLPANSKSIIASTFTFPTSLVVNGAQVTLIKIGADDHAGIAKYSAHITKGVQAKDIAIGSLSGFQTSLTDAQKVLSIQGELDGHTSIALPASITRVQPSALTDIHILEVIHSAITMSYGITPVISAKIVGNGTLSFVATYTISPGHIAAKNIAISGLETIQQYKGANPLDVRGSIEPEANGALIVQSITDAITKQDDAVTEFRVAATMMQVDHAIQKMKTANIEVANANTDQVQANVDAANKVEAKAVTLKQIIASISNALHKDNLSTDVYNSGKPTGIKVNGVVITISS